MRKAARRPDSGIKAISGEVGHLSRSPGCLGCVTESGTIKRNQKDDSYRTLTVSKSRSPIPTGWALRLQSYIPDVA